MAWIEAHQGLANHKKTIRLRKLLNIKKTEAIGTLLLLWWWAMDNAPDGDISELDAGDIAEIIEYKGKNPQTALDALIESGFVDSNMRIHDWDEYIGKLIEKRKNDAERKRTVRSNSSKKSGTSNGCPADVQRTSNGHPTERPMDVAGNRTVPYRTVPNRTISTTPLSTDTHADAPSEEAETVAGVEDTDLRACSDFYTKTTGKLLPPALTAEIQQCLQAGAEVELITHAIGISLGKNNAAAYFRGVMQNKLARGIKTYQQLLAAEGANTSPKVITPQCGGNPFLDMLKEEGAI
jgi:hypothetical protein